MAIDIAQSGSMKEVIGYARNGSPIHRPAPTLIIRQAFIWCSVCGCVISTVDGPYDGAKCLTCYQPTAGN